MGQELRMKNLQGVDEILNAKSVIIFLNFTLFYNVNNTTLGCLNLRGDGNKLSILKERSANIR